MATIEITGLERIAHKLRTVEQISMTLGPPMQQSLMHLQRRVARPPRKAAGAFTALATPRQKRAYWARVRSGEITHDKRTGYRRTNTLVRKWSVQVKTNLLGASGQLTNNSEHGVFVQGERQQPFHKASGWPTVDGVAEKEAPAVQRYFDAAIKRALD